jgi:putative SOS response-associated peptidase YedK
MCGRYVLVTKIKTIEKRFNVKVSDTVAGEFIPNTNISHGNKSLVITDKNPHEASLFQFGFTPFWAKKQFYVINARAEGDKNKANDPEYTGAKEIFLKPMFRQSIRSKRCLILADCFYEGPEKEKLSKPYVVYLKNKERPFAFAGIWDEWVNTETGELIESYAIITTVSNAVTSAIGHHRSPVILHKEQESAWLDQSAELTDVLQMLQPYDAKAMNAYPVDAAMKHPGENGLELLTPIGERLFPESTYKLYDELQLQGMGMTTGRRKRLGGEG